MLLLHMVVKPTGPTKPFEWTIPYTNLDKWYPLIEVSFLAKSGEWVPIPLIFDSGAEATLLRPRYARHFPDGKERQVGGVGSGDRVPAPVITDIEFEFLQRRAKCDAIIIQDFPCHSFVGGLFGRNCFRPFGFGVWENARELYVTLKP
jgi:hypothetical protein